MKITTPKSYFQNLIIALLLLTSHIFYAQQQPDRSILPSNGKQQEYTISQKVIGSNVFFSRPALGKTFSVTAFSTPIDETRITADQYITKRYNRLFRKPPGFALPPAIFGNPKICFPTPGTTTLTGSGIPASSNPWVSSNPAVATVNASGVVTGVALGTTTITYTDNLGNNASVNVTVNPLPTITGALTKCVGGTTQLTGSGTPGAIPWTSSNPAVATVSNTGLVTGISAGTSTITYQNNNGCTETALVTINPLLVPTITCGGATTMQVSFNWTAVTGASTYTIFYKINGGASVFGGSGPVLTYTVTGVSPSDIVTLIVTPSGAVGTCFASGTVNCTAMACTAGMLPPAPVVAVTQPTCSVATGDISITAAAGLTFNLDGGAFSGTLAYSGLASGSHVVKSRNALGCTSTTNVTINPQPATPAAPTLTATQPTCTVATGTVTITGVAGETYSFDTGAYSATLIYSGLIAGSSHTVTAMSAGGCISPVSNITINAQPPIPTAPTLTVTQPTCTVATGTITITAVAGETYSFDGSAYGATLVFPGLTAGSIHNVYAKNGGGCISLVSSVTLNSQPPTPAAPTLTATQPTCTVATGTVTITGVAGLTYSFDGSAYSATLVYGGLPAGSTHNVTAQNASGCISPISSITLNAQPATPSAPILSATQPTCTVATGTITITGVAGETYSVDGSPYSATVSYGGITPGVHGVTAKNAVGCISIVSNNTINPQPATPTAPTLTAAQPTCGVATGTITITGVAGETYSVDGGLYSATLIYSGIAPGVHNVAAKNAAGCISSISNITINPQPPTPAAPTLAATQPTCTVATGTITITGVAGNTYSLDGNAYAATLIYSGIAPGGHGVTAKNAAGCISPVTNITINPQPATPVAPVLTAIQPTCVLGTGTITITGVAGETYSLDASAYTATLIYSGIAPGVHAVTAKNAAGCISSVSNITINPQPATPAPPALTATQPTCTVATGSVTITGIAGLTYSFDGGLYSATLVYSGLPAGSTHNVTAQNAAGCISAISAITLNVQPATPSAPTVAATQPTCTLSTGTITVTGVSGETYSVDGGAYSGTLIYGGITPGVHGVTAKNAAGCISAIANITINPQPSTPVAPTVAATQPTCSVATGSITITGVAGETYSVDGSAYSATLIYSGIAPGVHVVTAKNGAGCVSSASNVTINPQPATPAAPTLSVTQPTCTVATGAITISGVAGETYSVDAGAYSATLNYSGIAPGIHGVTSKNAAGCISSTSNITINPQPVTPAAPTLSATQPTCTVATGTITITGVGGETYSIDGGGYSGTLVNPGIAPGVHGVTAKNAAGCISSVSTITINPQPATPTAPTLGVTQPTCTLATGTITVTGVAGETYSLDGNAYSATLIYNGLTPGVHGITAQNAAGCISSISNVTVNPQPATPAAPTLAATQPTCTLATGTIAITGVAGETYSVDGSAYSGTLTISGIAPGVHGLTAKNAAGCISPVANITVNPQPATPAAPTLGATQPTCTVATGTVTITGIAGETYSLDGNAYSATLIYSGVVPGVHGVTAKNAAGCISPVSNITINPQPATPSAPTLTATQPTCTSATGTISITAVAGETYSFDGALYSATLVYSGLPAGSSHTVTAQNAAGCVSPVSNILLNAQPVTPAAPVLAATQPTCAVSTGTITITGIAGETYSFDGGVYSATLTYSGVAPGSHGVTAKNASGCISPVANIIINPQPPTPAAPLLAATQPTCTVATGMITITGISGETYSVDGSIYSATLVYSGITPGVHTATAKNAAGCISSTSNITINPQPATPSAPTLTATQPTCTTATGTVTITAVTGETYSFDGGSYSATIIYGGLPAGSSHTVTAQNAAGCVSPVTNITLNVQPATPVAPTLTATQPSCSVATGSITITGVAGETYSVDGNAYSATLIYSGVTPGVHGVTAKNAAGCISSVSNVTINPQPATPNAPTLVPTQPTCTSATGSITITGVIGETYSFDGGVFSATLVYNGLAANSAHNVRAQNAAGCISPVTNITLDPQPVTPPAPALSATQPTCTVATGTITITGVAGEIYNLDGGTYSTTLVYTGVAVGSHNVTAKNAAGCISPASTVTFNAQPGTPSAPTLSAIQPNCTVATGTITVTAVAGETYSIDGGTYSGSLIYSGITPGVHGVTAKNATGCISPVSNITINPQPATPSAPFLTPTQPTCTLATGSITITPNAGETYSFDGGGYSAILIYNGLAAGSTHNVTAQNAAGCISGAATITLNGQPVTPAAPTISATQPTCTVATGTITISGIAGETYNLDGGAYSSALIYSGIAIGTHNVTAKNAVGCISPASTITLNAQPGTPSAPTLNATQPTCTSATGTITITGIAGETYSVDGSVYSSTLIYNGITPGVHGVTAKNATGCISPVSNITINPQPAIPAAPILATTQPSCTVSTGSITIIPVVGETYNLDGGTYSNTLTYSGILPGIHGITAKNAAGCISPVSNITINPQPATPSAPAVTATQPTCTVATGSITITGISGETYSIDGGVYSSTLIYNGIATGMHSVTAKNAAGCVSTATSVTISPQPGTPSAPILTATQPNCTVSTGTITITGVAGETYSLDGGAFSSSLVYSGISIGTHSVSAKNTAGCVSPAATVALNAQPGTPSAPTLTATQPTCTVATGSITITSVSGEVYSFDGGAYSATLTYNTLAPGVYSATARNATGCISAVSTITINPQPTTPSVPVVNATQPSCTLATGTVTITGVAGLTYSFDGSAYTSTLVYSGLAASSTHTVTAANAAGCISAPANIVFNAQPATPAAPVFNVTQPTCSTATGTVTINGTSGETYSLDGNPYASTLIYSGLVAGSSHNITARNAAGCISTASTLSINPQPQTPVASALPASSSVCDGNIANVILSSTLAGTSFTWTVVQNNVSGATSGTGNIINEALSLTGNATGTAVYTIIPSTVECTGNAITVTVTVNRLPAPDLADGKICVDKITGATVRNYTLNTKLTDSNYSFEWYFEGNIINGATQSTYEAELAGVYAVIVTNNATGCISIPVSATVTESFAGESIATQTSNAFSDEGVITVLVNPSNPDYQYKLDDGLYQNSNVFTGVTAGNHIVTVIDANGCTNLSAEALIIGYPKFFTPNGDGYHDTWNIIGIDTQPDAKIYIFDRYGKLIKQISPAGDGWDGTFNGYNEPADDYWFSAQYQEKNQDREFKGHFALKR